MPTLSKHHLNLPSEHVIKAPLWQILQYFLGKQNSNSPLCSTVRGPPLEAAFYRVGPPKHLVQYCLTGNSSPRFFPALLTEMFFTEFGNFCMQALHHSLGYLSWQTQEAAPFCVRPTIHLAFFFFNPPCGASTVSSRLVFSSPATFSWRCYILKWRLLHAKPMIHHTALVPPIAAASVSRHTRPASSLQQPSLWRRDFPETESWSLPQHSVP